MPEYKIAAIPGDGIGAEVVAAGLKVLAALEARVPNLKFTIESFPWGSDYYREHGRMMAEDGIARLADFDCLDPAFAPGTGTPVAGGLTSHQALSIIRGLGNINFVGMDLVEVAPAYDNAEVTAINGATIVHDFLCLVALRKSKT